MAHLKYFLAAPHLTKATMPNCPNISFEPTLKWLTQRSNLESSEEIPLIFLIPPAQVGPGGRASIFEKLYTKPIASRKTPSPINILSPSRLSRAHHILNQVRARAAANYTIAVMAAMNRASPSQRKRQRCFKAPTNKKPRMADGFKTWGKTTTKSERFVLSIAIFL